MAECKKKDWNDSFCTGASRLCRSSGQKHRIGYFIYYRKCNCMFFVVAAPFLRPDQLTFNWIKIDIKKKKTYAERTNIVSKNSTETGGEREKIALTCIFSLTILITAPGQILTMLFLFPHHIAPCHFTSSSVSPSASFLYRIHYHKELNVLYLLRFSAWKVKLNVSKCYP